MNYSTSDPHSLIFLPKSHSNMTSMETKMAMAKTVLSTVGSIAATAMVARSVARDYLPDEFQEYLSSGIRNFLNRFTNQLTLVIYEFDGLITNEIYEAVHLFLADRISPSTQRLKITKPRKEKNISVAVESDEEIIDAYNNAKFRWVLVKKKTASREYYNNADMTSTVKNDVRSFELTFHKKHKVMALDQYLPYVLKQANIKKLEDKSVKIFTVDTKRVYSGYPTAWASVNLDHPATFDTLAMDTDMKDRLVKDLERFVSRKEYYKKVGKAWKRGYLLYGQPGTGKSSLIAAMANFLNFDIYDLELTAINSNSELRNLLVATGNRSILVVEDIDCSIALHDREAGEARAQLNLRHGYREENKITLSGFLNFIDGLWSSCGDERIIIFTTNRKDKLDPALLRPGRMDLHIHMSYCSRSGFRLLAANYLGIKTHESFEVIDELIGTTDVTPAEVAEQLLKDDNPDVSLEGLIEFLHVKKKENEEAKAKKENAVSAEKEKEEGEDGLEDVTENGELEFIF